MGGGGRCCCWEPILSLWSDWLLDSELRQRCSEGRTAAATRGDLSSASSSAVFPHYSQRLNCRHTSRIFLLSHSREGWRKKKPYLLIHFQRNLSMLQRYKSCSSTEIRVSPTSQRLERFRGLGGKTLTLCRCLCACVS